MTSKLRPVLLALFVFGPACARALHGRVRVPHPLAAAADGPAAVVIRISDARAPAALAWPGAEGPIPRSAHAGIPNIVAPRWMEEEAFLRRACSDEVTFDLQLAAEWKELAGIGDFEISLQDDRGARWAPVQVSGARLTSRDLETTYQTWKAVQRVQVVGADGGNQGWTTWAPEEQPVRQQVFVGGGVIGFRAPALLRPDTRELTLTLRSRARTLRFTWEFEPLPVLAHAAVPRACAAH